MDGLSVDAFGSPGDGDEIDQREACLATRVIREHLVAPSEEEYGWARYWIERDGSGLAQNLVVYLARRDCFWAECAKVALGPDFAVLGVDRAVGLPAPGTPDTGAEIQLARFDQAVAHCAYDVVLGAPIFDHGETGRVTERAIAWLEALFGGRYSVKVLAGAAATCANYQSHLLSRPKGFVSIGHGSQHGLVLHDGTLSHAWFSEQPQAVAPGRCVVFLNTCFALGDPMGPDVLGSGVRAVIGGKGLLTCGVSEEVTKNFWRMAVEDSPRRAMGENLSKAIQDAQYPRPRDWGILGDCDRPFDGGDPVLL